MSLTRDEDFGPNMTNMTSQEQKVGPNINITSQTREHKHCNVTVVIERLPLGARVSSS